MNDEWLDSINARLEAGEVLSSEQARQAMSVIADGRASVPRMVCFLENYNNRLPEPHELAAFVRVLRARAIPVRRTADYAICNCGTGGDGRGTINVSTIAAFVIAACGVPVAKHGNRSVSSLCGSTDCLTALGVRASSTPDEAERLLETHGLCFLNAPDYHPAMKHVAPARRELAAMGRKSLFNLLGPMLNPAGVVRQSMGVFSDKVLTLAAEVLLDTGTRRAYVIHGDGFDEVTLTGPTKMALIDRGRIETRTVTPEELGMTRCAPEDLKGGDPPTNARIAEAILAGRLRGPMADMVIVNVAAGLSVGALDGRNILDAVEEARDAVRGGRGYPMLQAMRKAAPIRA